MTGGRRPHEKDQWLINGSPDFGWIPGGMLDTVADDAPIRLYQGDIEYGALHIEKKHGHWVKKSGLSVPELVWTKCHQSGKIFHVLEEPKKLLLSLQLSPSALLVLRYTRLERYFTVVTLYYRDQAVVGDYIGKYSPANLEVINPVFTVNEYTPPQVTIKKSRKILSPC